MACYHPLDAWHHPTEKKPILAYNPGLCHSPQPDFKLPCGRCVGCRLDRSRKWAIRCMHEAQMHRDNCFITLTYAPFTWLDTRRDSGATLIYPEFQKFMKRLRKRFPGVTIRFYMAGEYGEQFGRPHFHACIFGMNFPDRDFLARTQSGSVIYRSKILEELWPFGYSSIGDFSFETAAYVARYVMKKITGDIADMHYERFDPATGEIIWREPEFNRMSLKPGIGASWLMKYKTDVFPHDHVIVNGHPVGVPRYYSNLYERIDDCGAFVMDTKIRPQRLKNLQSRLDDNTPDRLKVKEQVALSNLKRLKRKLV